jgi:hypothetical protein
MNLDVIRELGSDGPAGQNSIANHTVPPRLATPDTASLFQDNIVLSRIFRGSTGATVFEGFIAQLLQHCGRCPEPKSVLAMDNASFYHSERLA